MAMRHQTGKQDRRSQGRFSVLSLSRQVFLLAVGLISLAAAALFYVGLAASSEADDQSARNETRLFDNALRDALTLMAHQQQSLTHWDRSIERISMNFDKEFIQSEFVDSLWYDLGHLHGFLIGPGNRLIMSSNKDRIDFSSAVLLPEDIRARFAAAAVTKFRQRFTSGQKGMAVSEVGRVSFLSMAELGFALIDGRPALVSALALTPDELPVPDGDPVVLVSARTIDADLLANLNAQLAFPDFGFVAGSSPPADTGRALIGKDGAMLGYFQWTGARPGAGIFALVIPLAAVLASVMAGVALVAAWRIGQLSTRLEISERRNRSLALQDALSGLANRLQVQQTLADAVQNLPNAPFVLICCDLDRFKAVNDRFGHPAGDTVIKKVADRLAGVVGSAGLVGRIGGDEFVLLITAFHDRPRLTILTRQIVAAVTAPITLENGAITDVGISLGLAIAPADAKTETAITACADQALYSAKENGRGMAVFFSDLAYAHAGKAAPQTGTLIDSQAA